MSEREPYRPQPEAGPEIDEKDTDEEFGDFEDELYDPSLETELQDDVEQEEGPEIDDEDLWDDEEGEDEERREETPETRVEKKLESLGLTPEAITAEVPEFNDLSEGKQLLVLENLQQLTLGRIQEEARYKYRADVQESKFLGRVWKGVSKQWQIKGHEKATAKELQEGGIETHRIALEQLTSITEAMPEVEVGPDGKLAIGYAEEFEDATREQKWAVANFNRSANAFARMPEEWSFASAGDKEQKRYKAAKEVYDEAKNMLLNARRESLDDSELDEARAMDYMNKAEFGVRMNQFLNTHPDVEKQLRKTESQWAWAHAIKDAFVERAGYSVGGFVGRSVSVGLLGWAAAPIVAAGFGAWRGRARAKETLGEREKAARKGVEDKSAEAKSVVDAEDAVSRLRRQINKIEKAVKDGVEISKKDIESLKVRIDYTRNKIESGRMNYGSKEERLANRYDTLNALASADAFFYAFGGDSAVEAALQERLDAFNVAKDKRRIMDGESPAESVREERRDKFKRLDAFLAPKEEKITESRNKYIREKTLEGARMGAAFAFIGHELRAGYEMAGLDETLGRVTSVWGRDEAVDTDAPDKPSIGEDKTKNTPPLGPLHQEGLASESSNEVGRGVQGEITRRQDANLFEATGGDAPETPLGEQPPEDIETTPEAVAAADRERIARTAEHFGFKPVEGKEGALALDMAEAAEKDPNLGKLEQVLDRLVAAQYVEEFGEKLSPEAAAKILNMAANLRVAFEQGDASFMDKWTPQGGEDLSDLFKESLEYDADNKTITISNQEKFKELVDGLKAHADELETSRKLEGAVGELPKITRETWRDIVNAAQDKNIEVEDYSKNKRVMEAYEANRAREEAALEAAEAKSEAGAGVPEVAGALEGLPQKGNEKLTDRLIAKDFSPSALAEGLREYDRFGGKTLNGKLGVIYDTFLEKRPELKDAVAFNQEEYSDAYEKQLSQEERNTLEQLRPYEEAKPGADRAEAAQRVAEYDTALAPDAEVREYADVRTTLAQAKLERVLDEAGRFSGKHEQIFEGVSRLAGEQGAMKPEQAKIFTRWLAERGGDETLSEGDLKKLGLWDNDTKAFDEIKLNSYMDTFVEDAQGRRTIEALPTEDKSEWVPVSLRGEDGQEVFGLAQHVQGTGKDAVYNIVHPEHGKVQLDQGLSRNQVQDMLFHESTAYPSEVWGENVPETKFLGVSIPAETPELVFADKYSALERENIQDYFDHAFARVHEMERQFPEFREKYGDRPRFASFEEEVRKDIQQTMRRLNGMAREVRDPGGEVRATMSGNMTAAESARIHFDMLEHRVGLTTAQEKADELLSRVRDESDVGESQARVPEAVAENQKPAVPESTAAETPAAPESTTEVPEATGPLADFLKENTDPEGKFAEINEIQNDSDRKTALRKLSDADQDKYTRYRFQGFARDVVDHPGDTELAQKLSKGIKEAGILIDDNERKALEQLLEKK